MLLVRHAQSEWNLYFGRTRIDPGIPDPALTEHGRNQAAGLARALAAHPLRKIVASPYRRAVETARIIAETVPLPIEIDPLIRERCAFSCDQGSHPDSLAAAFPEQRFDHLDAVWWGGLIESEASIQARAARFRERAAAWRDQEERLVVSHWGFLRALTGLEVENATLIRFDPSSGRSELADPAG